MKTASLTIRASHRIELAGDWTDLPAYCERHGGRMLNWAVDLAGLAIEVEAQRLGQPSLELVSLDGGLSEQVESTAEWAGLAPQSPFFLAKATILNLLCRRGCADLSSFLVRCCGGGVRILTHSNAPAGSGLGSSSILATLVRLALAALAGEPLDPQESCWQNYEMETALRLGSGWQDQLGGILPGIKDISYHPGGRPQIGFLEPPREFLDLLADLAVPAYTGQTRYSGDILNEVGDRIRCNPGTVAILDTLKATCDPMRMALLSGDYDAFGRLVNEITALETALHPGIVTENISDLFARTKDLCQAARVCGAGGAGFVLFFARACEQTEPLRELLSREGLQCFKITPGTGLRVECQGADEVG